GTTATGGAAAAAKQVVSTFWKNYSAYAPAGQKSAVNIGQRVAAAAIGTARTYARPVAQAASRAVSRRLRRWTVSYDPGRPSIAAPQAREAGDIDYLLRLLNDPEAEAREQAAYNLGRLGDSRAVPFLLARLQASSDSMRLMVLGALASIGDISAADDVYVV